MSLCSIHVHSECHLISQQHQQQPSDLLYAPCPKVINDNLCESQCRGARQAGDQAAERRADSRSGDASVGGAPLNVGKHCLLASAVLSLVVIKYICTYAY